MQGMSKAEWEKGNSTRSGLLWEVERILKECTELPDVLLMENVPQVHAEQNKADFDNWCNFLKSKGYINHWQDLNAKDYGIPQNRERCFMVSILSKDFIDFEFPEKIKLQKVMRDFLEESVDEKYYIKNEKAQKLIKDLIANGTLRTEQNRTEQNRLSLTIDLTSRGSKQLSVVPCITSRYDAGICKHKLERGGVLELSQN
jgi:DNA (cytosine-5)-methyltransferase 1